MEVDKIVVHELIKQQKELSATVFLTTEYLEKNVKSDRLGLKLNESFSKDDITHGIFKMEANEFYYHFNEYRNSQSPAAFIEFSSIVTGELSGIISNEFWAKGGFLVFVEYSVNNTRFAGVYLIRDVEGVLFQKNEKDNTFAINTAPYIDTNKLAMGCRINIDKLENHDGNHLSLIKNGQKDISEYFFTWIGVDKPESNKEFTEKLFNIISDLKPAIDPESGEPYDINSMREFAFNSIKSSAGKTVNLRQLGFSLYGDEEILINYANENNIAIDTEFRYDNKSLSKFKKIDISRDGIRLTFSRGDIKTKIRLSEENEGQIIIESPRFADALRAQINER